MPFYSFSDLNKTADNWINIKRTHVEKNATKVLLLATTLLLSCLMNLSTDATCPL